jgi:hypothetical protein
MDDRIARLVPYSSTTYTALDIDRLVVFAAVESRHLGIPLSLENLIVISYRLFPEKFSIDGYPEYPDATRVEKSLWRSRGKKKWLEGKTRHGYMVSDRSEQIAEQVRAALGEGSVAPRQRASRLRRHDSIIRDAMASPAFSKFASEDTQTISWGDVCYLLQGTLDSSKETLRANMDSLAILTNDAGEARLADLLEWTKENFDRLSGVPVSKGR